MHRAIKTALSPRRSTTNPVLLEFAARDQVDGQSKCNFAQKLFSESMDLARKALDTQFIQGIKAGTLDPTVYGGYTVQDAAYVYNGADLFVKLNKEAAEQGLCDLANFAQHEAKSWGSFAQQMLKNWHISEPSAVALNIAAKDYQKFKEDVFESSPPYYMIIALLPCNRLWAWLAKTLEPFATESNLYAFWITGNISTNDHWDNFVNHHASKFDYKEALEVFRKGMEHEVDFFQSAFDANT
ncbi:uncharacterized protein LOC134193393 isoform X2 [Corticium candelabrum]|uniref:uncharacterized protein LOC134193393 isoform X2 n=1 Tax=Corticium candelabrum TaxID=121492 RepID=UPI002E269315|nr:uncharacterized protein LOC134193393 isoform X2 [Corticium candelabrum]